VDAEVVSPFPPLLNYRLAPVRGGTSPAGSTSTSPACARAIGYLIDMLVADRLLVGSDFPAMPREQPAGRTLLSMGLPGAVLADITWHNCFRFLGIDPPRLFSSREQHRFPRAGDP
jgi:hypothetical protein